MNFVQSGNAREKEKIKEDIRNAREELLELVDQQKRKRLAKNDEKRDITGMMPPLVLLNKTEQKSKKSSKKSKKEKKLKKDKKRKKKSKRKHSSSKDDNNSTDTEDEILTKKKKKRKMSTDSSSSSSSTSSKEWVEKETERAPVARDDWMTSPMLLKTYSKNDSKPPVKEKQQIDAYDPGKSSRELNPHWKDGGTGLPTFRKPRDDFEDDRRRQAACSWTNKTSSGGWKKQKEPMAAAEKLRSQSPNLALPSEARELEKGSDIPQSSNFTSHFLTDQEMNEMGAKIIKAEIMGNDKLAEELKKKLEMARSVREQTKKNGKPARDSSDDHVLLTTTDNKGSSRPLLHRVENESDRYGGRRGKQKNKKAETHVSGERVRYFPDDDKYDIKQMFEREKYTTAADSDAQFAEIAGKRKNPKDDLDDIFADKVRKNIPEHETADKEKQRAIFEHEKLSKQLDNCDKCFDSRNMEKQLMVSMGKNVYLALPWHEGLQPNHCLIVPIQHCTCSTLLDEDTWEEMSDYRKALTKMFADHKQDVVFFETARYLHKRPHMVIHCVPAGSMEMAPFYFKKAIQESEYEWSTNKQLVSLKDKGLRRAIPKGLPYFWVNFGMESGFAHVIEDQERFPSNFAQEIIGGMLHLDASKWRRPRKEHNVTAKVKNLADWWKPYDFTN